MESSSGLEHLALLRPPTVPPTVGIWNFPRVVGPQYRPPNMIVHIGTPKKGPSILGNPLIQLYDIECISRRLATKVYFRGAFALDLGTRVAKRILSRNSNLSIAAQKERIQHQDVLKYSTVTVV